MYPLASAALFHGHLSCPVTAPLLAPHPASIIPENDRNNSTFQIPVLCELQGESESASQSEEIGVTSPGANTLGLPHCQDLSLHRGQGTREERGFRSHSPGMGQPHCCLLHRSYHLLLPQGKRPHTASWEGFLSAQLRVSGKFSKGTQVVSSQREQPFASIPV